MIGPTAKGLVFECNASPSTHASRLALTSVMISNWTGRPVSLDDHGAVLDFGSCHEDPILIFTRSQPRSLLFIAPTYAPTSTRVPRTQKARLDFSMRAFLMVAGA